MLGSTENIKEKTKQNSHALLINAFKEVKDFFFIMKIIVNCLRKNSFLSAVKMQQMTVI